MSAACVVGVFKNMADAQAMIARLEADGFRHENISLVTQNVSTETGGEQALATGDMTEKDAALGAAGGGMLGLLLGTPLLLIPGLGPILLAGPIAAGMTGAIVGGFLGAMGGWGVPDNNLAAYQDLVKDGNTLVVVSGDPVTVARAGHMLQDSEAESVSLHEPGEEDSPEINDA